MGKKNTASSSGAQSTIIKGKNGPSNAQSNKNEVGGKKSNKD